MAKCENCILTLNQGFAQSKIKKAKQLFRGSESTIAFTSNIIHILFRITISWQQYRSIIVIKLPISLFLEPLILSSEIHKLTVHFYQRTAQLYSFKNISKKSIIETKKYCRKVQYSAVFLLHHVQIVILVFFVA